MSFGDQSVLCADVYNEKYIKKRGVFDRSFYYPNVGCFFFFFQGKLQRSAVLKMMKFAASSRKMAPIRLTGFDGKPRRPPDGRGRLWIILVKAHVVSPN